MPSLKRNINSAKTAEDAADLLAEQEARDELDIAVDKGITLSDDEDDTPQEYEMLCGYKDKDGVLHTTFTLREMTGRDEEAISKTEIKRNPAKAIGVLLSRTVQSIGTLQKSDFRANEWADIIGDLYSGDQDVMIMRLREISISDEIKVQHKCPECGAKLNTVLTIDELEVKPFLGATEIPFELSKGYRDRKGVVHKTGILRLSKGKDREILAPMAQKNISRATTALLTRLCKFDDGMTMTDEVMANLTVRDRDYLSNLLEENTFGYNLTVEVECDQCGETFNGNLNAVNFLR